MKIPEFEKREKSARVIWSNDELDTMKRYYQKVKAKELIPFLKDKTEFQIHQKATRLGLTIKRTK